ncbi:MAG: amidase [Acidimicrobiia bacterium]
MDDLAALDATGHAELVRSGAASPVELVDAAIARIEALQPSLHALTTERFDRARSEAASPGLPDGPFRGVPFLFKDLACAYEGEPAYEGMQALKEADHRAPATTNLARRFRDAGLVVLGRASTPELGIMPTTEPVSYGATHNPWDVARTPGGSSGGSAAAVASGMVPAAHASDGGGSIRIPASCCGLVGLKTSRGRVSIGPAQGELSRFLSVQFTVTRSVRDCAALLDVVAGADVGDPVLAPPNARPFVDEVGADPGRLRVGIMTTMPETDEPVHPDCVTAAERAAKMLEALGHDVEVSHPAACDEPDRIAAFIPIWATLAASNLDAFGAALGRELTADDVEPLTWWQAEHGRSQRGTDFLDAVTKMQAFSRRMLQWWADGFDLLLTPTLGEPPLPLGVLQTPEDPLRGYARSGSFTPYTPVANQTGQPAISLPLHENADGLPIGVHLVATYGREDLLLRVAAQLEAADPWAARRPAAFGQ